MYLQFYEKRILEIISKSSGRVYFEKSCWNFSFLAKSVCFCKSVAVLVLQDYNALTIHRKTFLLVF